MKSKLIVLQKTPVEIRQTILTNVVKMIAYRAWIPAKSVEEQTATLIKLQPDDLVYKTKIDSGNFHIKFTGQKVTTINNTYGLKDFLFGHKSDRVLIVVKEISKKAGDQLRRQYPKAEVFTEGELMIDLGSFVYFHRHEKLYGKEEEKEIEQFLDDYNLSSVKRLPKMLDTDPGARYLALKKGDICKIIRPSETSGYVNFYRLVV